jgi:anti-sigma-K factor RskA
MNHQDYKEMIPAHALSALDAADDRVLTDHLTECAECRREFGDWQETCAGLALDAQPIEPSSEIRKRVLSQIRNDKAETIIPFPSSPKKNVWSSFGSLGAIAAAILFVALLVYVIVLWRENRAMQDQLVQLKTEIENTKKDLETQANLMKILSKPGTRFAELTGMPAAPGATATLAYDTSGHAMVMTNGLPAAPAGKAYQLWFIVSGKPPMPGKTFSPDAQGKAIMVDQIPAGAMTSAVFAVTLEPKDGVPSPTGPMYLKSGS